MILSVDHDVYIKKYCLNNWICNYLYVATYKPCCSTVPLPLPNIVFVQRLYGKRETRTCDNVIYQSSFLQCTISLSLHLFFLLLESFFQFRTCFCFSCSNLLFIQNIQIFLINTKINKYIEIGTNLIRKKLTKKNTPKNTLISRTERFFFHNFWFAILNLSSMIFERIL